MPKIFKFLLLTFAVTFLTACFHQPVDKFGEPIATPERDTTSTDKPEETSDTDDTVADAKNSADTDIDADTDADNNTDTDTSKEPQKTPLPPTNPKNIDVTFITPTPIKTEDILSKEVRKEIIAKYQGYNSPDEISFDKISLEKYWYGDESGKEYISGMEYFFDFYEIGTIKKDPYKDWKLVLLFSQCDGMCFGPDIYRFAWNKRQGKLIALMKHSRSEWVASHIEPLLITSDSATSLTDFQTPDSFEIPATNNKYVSLKQAYSDFQPEELGKLAFTHQEFGDVYFGHESSSCLYLLHPDGTVSRYVYENHFANSPGYFITWWEDNSKDTEVYTTYRYASGGCGFMDGCYPLKNIEKEKDHLEQIGMTSNKIEIYAVKDPSKLPEDSELKQELDTAYEAYKYSNPDATFNNFLKIKPVIFWQDPFDRWSVLINNESSFPAECAKPVIYLYPKTATDVSVQVGIDKLTESIPQYGKDGWFVRTEPNGQITNYEDGQTYPYLFWEGEKNGDTPIERGFVIHREELSKFLKTSLKKLGLNKQESKDFREYWEDRMLKNNEPYFFISFVGTRDFDKIAPLKISPKPDTIIRVFMYYRPITAPFTPSPQYLKTIPRKGFTVIEWGGTEAK